MDKYAYPLMDKFEAAGLKVVGYGGGAMRGISTIAIGMRYQGYPSVDQCRSLALALANQAMADAEGNTELERNVDGPPFGLRHLQMIVSFEGEDQSHPEGFVTSIGVSSVVNYYLTQNDHAPLRVLHFEEVALLKDNIPHVSVQEALRAIPKTRAEASPPIWNQDTNLEEISGDAWDDEGIYYRNPKYHLIFASSTPSG
ncbi:MAG: hypothetical protein KDK78_01280 [Chlamydiia bacterium]|nr:hypothetical protein [Chlamydiia bacterium]